MKNVVAIVRPERFQAVNQALTSLNVQGMTVSEVMGFGAQKGQPQIYRGNRLESRLLPKLKIEVVVTDERFADVVEAIAAAARTGQTGDGKIFVLPVEDAQRIRTGETGRAAV